MTEIGGPFVELVVTGDTYDDAAAAAKRAAAESDSVLVPAFDDPATIAGQGTIAPEIVAALGRAPDLLVVPVGGGGLLAGLVSWFAERHPATRIVGVEGRCLRRRRARRRAAGRVGQGRLLRRRRRGSPRR